MESCIQHQLAEDMLMFLHAAFSPIINFNLLLQRSDPLIQKIYALARIAAFMDLKQRRNIMKTFVESQYGYCPLIWVFHSRRLDNKINRVHQSAIRITCKDKSSTFQKLLEEDNSASIHHKNVQILTMEIHKVFHGLSPSILNDVFVLVSHPYNFRWNDALQTRRVNSARHGTESISFLGPDIWDLVPSDIKLSLVIFKRKIKKWVPCRPCKIYLQHVGFIQWTPGNSLNSNEGVSLSVYLINVYLPVCSNWFEKFFRERFHLLYSNRVDVI